MRNCISLSIFIRGLKPIARKNGSTVRFIGLIFCQITGHLSWDTRLWPFIHVIIIAQVYRFCQEDFLLQVSLRPKASLTCIVFRWQQERVRPKIDKRTERLHYIISEIICVLFIDMMDTENAIIAISNKCSQHLKRTHIFLLPTIGFVKPIAVN